MGVLVLRLVVFTLQQAGLGLFMWWQQGNGIMQPPALVIVGRCEHMGLKG